MNFDIKEISKVLNADLIIHNTVNLPVAYGVSIDSRTTKAGDLFFAIKGEKYDGADYINEAIKNGSVAIVIGREQSAKLPADAVALITDDSTTSLQILGNYSRKSIKNLKVIGITGSAGKTTAKEMTYSLLNGTYVTGKSEGNLNNLYGLPLSLSRMNGDEDLFVAEMGMSIPGELKKLTEIAKPDISVLLNVYPVHMVNFESIEKLAEAKAELFREMRSDGTVVYNEDNKWCSKAGREYTGRRVSYGIINQAEVMAENIRYRGFEGTDITLIAGSLRTEISIPRFGLQNVYNFLAAAAVAYALKIDINLFKRRINEMTKTPGRGYVYKLKENIILLDDSYNSNPVAMEMILSFLQRYRNEGRKVVVAGDMLELGKREKEEHSKIGSVIAKSDIDLLIAIGNLSKAMVDGALNEGMPESSVFHFADSRQAAKQIGKLLEKNDLVLVKGSHGVHTEIVVEKLKQEFM